MLARAICLLGFLAWEPAVAADTYCGHDDPDSDTCVTCVGKDECVLGGALFAFKQSQVGVFKIGGQKVNFRVGDNDVFLSLKRPEPNDYAAWILATLDNEATNTLCAIHATSLQKTLDPAAAKALLYRAHVWTYSVRVDAIKEVPYFDGYVGVDSIVYDGDGHGYRRSRNIIYKNLSLEQECMFDAAPQMDDPRFTRIGFTVMADESNPGFGDLIGEGGFIKPPTK